MAIDQIDQIDRTAVVSDADRIARPHLGPIATLALRSTALVVIAIVLILVLLPAALVAAGT